MAEDPILPPPITYGGFTQAGYPNTITYFWSAPEDASGLTIPVNKYNLQLVTDISGTPETITFLLDGTETMYRVIDLSSALVYTASIKASKDDGNTWGQEAPYSPVRPLDYPPYGPASATATRSEDRASATIEWTSPIVIPDFVGYYMVTSESSNPDDPVYVWKTPIPGWVSRTPGDMSCNMYDLNTESNFTFKVEVVNIIGSSPPTYTEEV